MMRQCYTASLERQALFQSSFLSYSYIPSPVPVSHCDAASRLFLAKNGHIHAVRNVLKQNSIRINSGRIDFQGFSDKRNGRDFEECLHVYDKSVYFLT